MAVMEICCQNAVAALAEYDYELHAFTNILDVVDMIHVPIAAMAVDGTITKGRLTSWWQDRAIPVTRDGYDQLRGDLLGTDRMKLLDDSYGLSLSDQFWMRPADSDVAWEEVNFFDNDFDGILGFLTLGSIGSFAERMAGGILSGPNSSLGGNLRKAWERREDGSTVLVKFGSAPMLQEPVNELIASLLYDRLLPPDDYVDYNVELRDGRAFSVCDNMVNRDECLIPARDIINAYKMPGSISPWQHVINCYERLGISDAERRLSKMLVCDYIIANADRHWNNFGLIFDAATMEAKRVAPIFDSGTSLWCWASGLDSDLDYWYRPLPMIRERARRIYPEDQLELVRDFSWFDPAGLDDFADEVIGALGDLTSLPDARILNIGKRVAGNIDLVISRAMRATVSNGVDAGVGRLRPVRP